MCGDEGVRADCFLDADVREGKAARLVVLDQSAEDQLVPMRQLQRRPPGQCGGKTDADDVVTQRTEIDAALRRSRSTTRSHRAVRAVVLVPSPWRCCAPDLFSSKGAELLAHDATLCMSASTWFVVCA